MSRVGRTIVHPGRAIAGSTVRTSVQIESRGGRLQTYHQKQLHFQSVGDVSDCRGGFFGGRYSILFCSATSLLRSVFEGPVVFSLEGGRTRRRAEATAETELASSSSSVICSES